ncbi:hypothetical protein AB0K16_08475 [Nonomuraea jabiensis]|uniref:hypothetical protein n=1 Tax=Nonomuraea jabiensis TaxID=882448 RepID=UPI00341EC5E8
MTDIAAVLRLELAGKTESDGWREALDMVPRERFLGDVIFQLDEARGDLWAPARRLTCPSVNGSHWSTLTSHW